MGVARVHEMHSNYLIFLKLLLGITLDAIQKLVIILILLPSQSHGKGCSMLILQSSYGKAFVLYSAV